MHSTIRFSRFVFLALPLLPLAADAAPNAAIVPADAKWMVYADFNVLRNSTLGKELMKVVDAQLNVDLPVKPNVDKIVGAIGTVTAYGLNFSEQPEQMESSAYVQGGPELRKITEGLLLSQTIAEPDHVVELTDLGFPAYGIKPGAPHPKAAKETAEGADKKDAKAEKPRDPNKIEVVIGYPPEGGVLISRSKAQLTRARDLLRGNGASLAKSNSPLKRFLGQGNDAYLFAASETPPEKMYPADAPPARIFKMAKSGALAIGEHNTETFAHVELLAPDDATAEKLMKILDGMTAMMSFTETNDRQLGEFLNAVAAGRDGDRVFVNITYPSARLVQMIENAKAGERPQGNRGGPQGPYVQGTLAAKWNGATYAQPADSAALMEASRVIDNVALKNGSTITLARSLNGARYAKFMRVEIVPAAGGAPLVFKSFIPAGPRGSAQNFEFPGADGNYTLNVVTSVGDPEGKVEYAVSVKDPRPAPAPKTANPERKP